MIRPTYDEIIQLAIKLRIALKLAHGHLEYCGYGDTWERSCANDSGLPAEIETALELSEFLDTTVNTNKS